MHHPEDQRCSIWQKAIDNDGDESTELDNNTFVTIILNEDLIQMMSVEGVEKYSDYNNGITSITYTRRRHSKAAPWGEWV